MVNYLIKLNANRMGKDYIVGDIHGCYDGLMFSLNLVGFDFEVDRLISVGDLIDRGSKSYECLNLLAEKWFYAVRGNHEQMMIDCLVNGVKDGGLWHGNGGQWELGHESSEIDKMAEYADMVMPYAIQIERDDSEMVGVVHADVSSAIWGRLNEGELGREDEMNLLWGRSRISGKYSEDIDGLKLVFCGHSVIRKNGEQFRKGEWRKWDHVRVNDNGSVMVNNVVYTDHGVIFEGGLFSFYDLYGNRIDAELAKAR